MGLSNGGLWSDIETGDSCAMLVARLSNWLVSVRHDGWVRRTGRLKVQQRLHSETQRGACRRDQQLGQATQVSETDTRSNIYVYSMRALVVQSAVTSSLLVSMFLSLFPMDPSPCFSASHSCSWVVVGVLKGECWGWNR